MILRWQLWPFQGVSQFSEYFLCVQVIKLLSARLSCVNLFYNRELSAKNLEGERENSFSFPMELKVLIWTKRQNPK